jgi:hypothetical protein
MRDTTVGSPPMPELYFGPSRDDRRRQYHEPNVALPRSPILISDTRQNRPPRLSMALAGALERAAGAIARLDAALASHPLRPAWAWRARLDAIRRQAAVDGKAIDPWHLAALIEGVRLRLDHTPVLIDRGIFAAADHAFALYRWFAMPDETQRAAIGRAADHLETIGNAQSPLLGAALGVHAWLDHGGARPPLRAALALYWQRRQVTALPCPLLTGARALQADTPWGWTPGPGISSRHSWPGPRTASPSSIASGPRRALLLPEGAGIRMLPRRSTSWPLPPHLRHRARRSARDGDQERDPSPRGFRRARQRQRGSPSVEAAALWAQAARRAVRGGGTAASAEAGPTSRSAGTGAARVRRRPG